jgi:hypothetical protein
MKEWMAKKSKEEGYSRSRLPSFTKEEIEMVKGEFQFRATSDTSSKKDVLIYITNDIKSLSGMPELGRVICERVGSGGKYSRIKTYT